MARPAASVEFDRAICDTLQSAAMSTVDLAGTLGAKSTKVYSHCRALEGRGVLTSSHTSNATLLFCLDDRRVVTGADYERCRDEGHQLRSFPNDVIVWALAA